MFPTVAPAITAAQFTSLSRMRARGKGIACDKGTCNVGVGSYFSIAKCDGVFGTNERGADGIQRELIRRLILKDADDIVKLRRSAVRRWSATPYL